MKQIRNKVFETNSSMTHSLVICENGEYDKWLENYDDPNIDKTQYYLFCADNHEFLIYEKAIKENAKQLYKDLEKGYLFENITKQDIDLYASETSSKSISDFTNDWYDMYLTFDEFRDMEDYCEIDEFDYTTKGGEHLTGFCYYGHD